MVLLVLAVSLPGVALLADATTAGPLGPTADSGTTAAAAGNPAADGNDALPGAYTEALLGPWLNEMSVSVPLDTLLLFYRTHNPDALAELSGRSRQDPLSGKAYFRTLTEHFLEMEQLRAASPEEYERVVQIERMESRSRHLARRIQNLGRALGGRPADPAALAREREQAKAELRDLLQQTFVVAQQNQLIEVNRLEAEVRELRRLLEERDANQRLILEQRFVELTGEGVAPVLAPAGSR